MAGRTNLLNWSAMAGAAAMLAVGGSRPAMAADGEVVLVAAPGDLIKGSTVSLTPEQGVGIDEVGNVVFHARTDDGGDAGQGWFRWTGSGRPETVILLNAPLPGGGGVDVNGLDLTFVHGVLFNPSSRLTIIGSHNSATGRDAILTSTGAGVLRTSLAVDRDLPGVCNILGLNGVGNIRTTVAHDDFVFVPTTVANAPGSDSPCTEQEDLGSALIVRQGTQDAQILAGAGLPVPLRNDSEFIQAFEPRGAFTDGSVVFTAQVNVALPGFRSETGVFTWKPGQPVTTIIVTGEAATGTTKTIERLGPARIVDGPIENAVEVIFGVQEELGDWLVYSTRENAAAAPVVKAGDQDVTGTYTLEIGRQAPAGLELLAGPAGQFIVIGATSGPDIAGNAKIGVWRYDRLASEDPTKRLTLLAYVGKEIDDRGTPRPIERIHRVHVNQHGRVALEVEVDDPLNAGHVALIEDTKGALQCVLRSGDMIPARADGQDLGNLPVSRFLVGQPAFPAVSTSGTDGLSSRFDGDGRLLVDVFGSVTNTQARGVYVVSIDGGSDPGDGGNGGGGNGGQTVKVSSKGGRMKVIGTKVADFFDIVMDDLGQATVTPRNGTTVNGGTDPVTADASKSLTVKTKDGDDDFSLAGADALTKTSKIKIDTGTGNDTAAVTNVETRKVTTIARGESNFSIVDCIVEGWSFSLARRAAAVVYAENITAKKKLNLRALGTRLTAKRGKGASAAQPHAVSAGELGVATSGDERTVAIKDGDALDLEARFYSGDVDLEVSGMTAEAVRYRKRQSKKFSDEYHDRMAILASRFKAQLALETDAATADLRFDGSTVEEDLLVELSRAGNVAIDFVNTTFGTSFKKRAICGGKKNANVTVTETGTKSIQLGDTDIPSVVNDLKGVIFPAKR